MNQLLQDELLCSPIFDETILFQTKKENEKGIDLRRQFKETFQNISSIMNCVVCEKCRVYGKLQTLALGTALKIVLEPNLDYVISQLQRNEIIVMVSSQKQHSTKSFMANYSPSNDCLCQLIFPSHLFLSHKQQALIYTFRQLSNSIKYINYYQPIQTPEPKFFNYIDIFLLLVITISLFVAYHLANSRSKVKLR